MTSATSTKQDVARLAPLRRQLSSARSVGIFTAVWHLRAGAPRRAPRVDRRAAADLA